MNLEQHLICKFCERQEMVSIVAPGICEYVYTMTSEAGVFLLLQVKMKDKAGQF
jgi:hypothetical protein